MARIVALLLLALTLALPSVATATEQTIPNGIRRIGAAHDCAGAPPFLSTDDSATPAGAPECQPLDYSAVNVAIVDTGIDLTNPDLNVVGGVDCTTPQEAFLPGSYKNTFADRSFRIEAYEDASWHDFARPDARGYDDGLGHGTHVAGIIGAKDDGRGVVGVAPNAALWSVRVLDSSGSGSIANIICGLDWIHVNRDLIDVVNMSLGADVGAPVMESIEPCHAAYEYAPVYLPQPERKLKDPLHEAICQLADDGIPVVVAAGNGDGLAENTIPAAYDEVITVSNYVDNDGRPGGLGGRNDTDACPFGGADDMLFFHHNFTPEPGYATYSGKAVDISAPGVCVLSTVPGGFAALTGTSMASPHVAGVVARFLADVYIDELGPWDAVHNTIFYRSVRNPKTLDDIRERILSAAERQDGSQRDQDQFWEPLVHVVGAGS